MRVLLELLGGLTSLVCALLVTGLWDPFAGDLFVVESALFEVSDDEVAEVIVVAHLTPDGRHYQPRIDVVQRHDDEAESCRVWSMVLRGLVEEAWVTSPEATPDGAPLAVVTLDRGGGLGRRTLVLDLRFPVVVAADLVGEVCIASVDEWLPGDGRRPIPLEWNSNARRFDAAQTDGGK